MKNRQIDANTEAGEYAKGRAAGLKHYTLPKFDQGTLEEHHGTHAAQTTHKLLAAYSKGYLDGAATAKPATVPPPAEINGSYVTPDGKAQIDFGITYRNGYAEFHAQGYYDGSAGQCLEEIAGAYPDDVNVRTLLDLWDGYHCENIGHNVTGLDFVKQFAATHPERSFYDHQAQQFLTTNGLRLRATLSDSKPAPWSPAGHHYRVTIWQKRKRASVPNFGGDSYSGTNRKITFDFWDSIANAEKDAKPTAYDVLACISSDAHCPDSFDDFCAEYGYDSDSIRARQTFNRCHSFARRLRAFFTPSELAQLSTIQ